MLEKLKLLDAIKTVILSGGLIHQCAINIFSIVLNKKEGLSPLVKALLNVWQYAWDEFQFIVRNGEEFPRFFYAIKWKRKLL